MFRSSLLAAAVMAAAVGTAQADTASANATLSNLRYRVIDLDLNDGVTATLTFTGLAQVSQQAGASNLVGGWAWDFHNDLPGEATASVWGAASKAGITSTGFGTLDIQLHAQSNTSYGFSGGNATFWQPFTLTANSMVVFYVDLSLVSALGQDNGNASTGASLSSWFGTTDGSKSMFTQSNASTWARQSDMFGGTGPVLNSTLGGALATTLVNAGTVSMNGNMSVGVSAASSIMTAVPEPSTYALMLAGLGAVGFVARRRHFA